MAKSLNGGSKGNLLNRPAICLYLDCFLNYSSNGFSRRTWNLSEMTNTETVASLKWKPTTDRARNALILLRKVLLL